MLKIVKFSGIYPLYLSAKSILDQTWQILNSKFESQWKDWKSRYIERQILAFVCKLIALISVQKFLKSLRVMQTPKTNQIWGKLKTRSCFQRQLLIIYLRGINVFLWNSTREEKFNFCFSEDFYTNLWGNLWVPVLN